MTGTSAQQARRVLSWSPSTLLPCRNMTEVVVGRLIGTPLRLTMSDSQCRCISRLTAPTGQIRKCRLKGSGRGWRPSGNAVVATRGQWQSTGDGPGPIDPFGDPGATSDRSRRPGRKRRSCAGASGDSGAFVRRGCRCRVPDQNTFTLWRSALMVAGHLRLWRRGPPGAASRNKARAAGGAPVADHRSESWPNHRSTASTTTAASVIARCASSMGTSPNS